jgi:hypothetical protein
VHGLLSLASVALNLFREFVPGHPDAAHFWLEIGAGSLSLIVVLGILLRFFGSENARPALLVFGTTLGLLLLAAGPAAVELYLLPSISAPTFAGVDTLSQWIAQRAHHSPWPARTTLLSIGLLLSLLFVVVPLTKWTFRVPTFLSLLAWLVALTTAGTVSSVLRLKLPASPPASVQEKKLPYP